MNDVEFLKSVRKVLQVETNWTKHTCARNRQAEPVNPNAKSAVAFCLVGASMKVDDHRGHCRIADLLGPFMPKERNCFHRMRLDQWNDKKNRTHDEVIKLINQGIERAEKYV